MAKIQKKCRTQRKAETSILTGLRKSENARFDEILSTETSELVVNGQTGKSYNFEFL